ncbi:MAG TPA: SLC13 family permease [Woeseiaceae bacterium]|nr:SLC13 family permease [Woeseiaceae bacterium]
MPAPPSLHAIAAILLAFFAVFLFTRDKIRLESSSLLVLIVILVWFEFFTIEYEGARVRAQNFLAGFGHEALITISVLMMLTKSLERTGALQPITHVLARLWTVRPQLAFLATIVTAAILSMFLNNTPVVAAILPLLVAVSLKAGVSPTGILMPVGFATIVGGMATTIGTSTNLLVVGIATDLGMGELQMFDFALPVFIVGGIAIVFLWLVAPRLLPDRRPPLTDIEPRIFDSRLEIPKGSFADSKTLREILTKCKNMKVNKIERGDLALTKLPLVVIRAGDSLHVSDTPENLKEYERMLGATLLAGDSQHTVSVDHPLESDEHVAEVVVTSGSVLERNTLDGTRLLSTYGLTPLALHRPGVAQGKTTETLGSVTLEAGDVILVQGAPRAIERLHRSGSLLVLDGRIHLPRTTKSTLSMIIMIGVVLVAATGLMRISVAASVGLTLMILTRCLTWQDAVGAIDRRIVMVIVASLALGLALMATGSTEYIAALYIAATTGMSIIFILSGFIFIMAFLTEIVSNNAIAVLGVPIAVSVAAQLSVPAEPFVIGLLYGANMSYIMPVGYQTNLLVMSAGGYRFSDFARVGLPLKLIMWIGLSTGLVLAYGL